MDNTVIISVLTMSGLGVFFASILAWVNKKFYVHTDPKLKEIEELLGGVNCGACGFASCRLFAEEILKGNSDKSCPLISQDKREKMASALGRDIQPQLRRTAVVHCGAKDAQRTKRSNYIGPMTCRAANIVGADLACIYGCIGSGDCVKVCPVGAITMHQGLPVVDKDKCVACGKCVEACPRGLLVMVPADSKVYVGCSSKHSAKKVKEICSRGCIGCKRCQKACALKGAIEVKDNLAQIDYTKCNSCGECVKVCPTGAIISASKEALVT